MTNGVDMNKSKGYWKFVTFYGGYYECSKCGHTQGAKDSKCPNCKSEMEQETHFGNKTIK